MTSRARVFDFPRAQLDRLCTLSFLLGHIEDGDWPATASGMRRYLARLPQPLQEAMATFALREDSMPVPRKHADRVAEIPSALGREIVDRILNAFGDEADDDEDDFVDEPLPSQLETLLCADETKMILRWLAFRDQADDLTGSSDSRSKAAALKQRTIVSAGDLFPRVAGLEAVKEALFRHVYLPVARPDLHHKYDVATERGVMLHGPPGNGKTELARQFELTGGFCFQYIAAPTLLSKWVGETEATLRRIFAAAEARRPAVIFIDEFDALGTRSEEPGSGEGFATQQLLTLMDGLRPLRGVFVIGATNRLDCVDRALLRPGRFGLILEVPGPGRTAIKAILKIHLEKKPLDSTIDLDAVVRVTDGFSGAQLKALADHAAREALGREITTGQPQCMTQLDLVRAAKAVANSTIRRR